MKWTLIVKLSLFGFVMGFVNLFFVEPIITPAIWIFIYLFSAYVIAKNCVSKFFLHGLVLGIFDDVWLRVVKNIFHKTYLAHAKGLIYQFDSVTKTLKLKESDLSISRQILIGFSLALFTGLILGILTFISAKLFKHYKTQSCD
jgi:hypothetical protein